MKLKATFNLALTLSFVGSFAFAQRGSLSEQRTCYEQARHFVTDENVDASFKYSFSQAHYEPKNHTCYVKMETLIKTRDDKDEVVVVVADAYEGKRIAECYSPLDSSHRTGPCHVNGQSAESRAVWNGLLWKMVPAFRPVNAETVK